MVAWVMPLHGPDAVRQGTEARGSSLCLCDLLCKQPAREGVCGTAVVFATGGETALLDGGRHWMLGGGGGGLGWGTKKNIVPCFLYLKTHAALLDRPAAF
jgi:hypothetical protein